ncbi:MAG: ATP-binding protein, partial [Chloroflexota bacterium]
RTVGRLQEALAALREGRGQTLRLTGEAGMGKSHLAAHLARQARAAGVQVAFGAAQSVSHNTPYLPWRQIFHALLGLQEQDEARAAARLERYLQERHPQFVVRLPLLGDLLGLPIPDNPTTAALDSDVRQEALFSLLVEIIRAQAGHGPVLLMVDNAQWMDEASWRLTQNLARGVTPSAPVLLVLLQRPGGDEGDEVAAAEVALGELHQQTVSRLIERQLGGAPAPLLSALIHHAARGNPFFVGELLAALKEGGQLARDGGAWQVGEGLLSQLQRANAVVQQAGQWRLSPGVDLSMMPLGLPDSIHGLVLSRLDRLPEAQKVTLKVSGVVGHIVDLALVARAHPDAKRLAEIRAEAVELAAHAVLREEAPEHDIYAFRHHTTQEVVYETLLYDQRRQLHGAVAQALVEKEPDAAAAIAYHAFLGQEWALALEHNLRAGEQARQLYANQQSIEFLQNALHSSRQLAEVDTDEQCKRIHLALGELYVMSGRHDDAQRHLQAALYLASHLHDPQAEAAAYRWQARSHEQRGDYAAALDYIEQGLAALDRQLSPLAAELDLLAGLIHARQGRFEQALALCRHSLEVSRQLDDVAIGARTYNLMGIVELRSNSSGAVDRFRQSLAQYQALGDVYGQATSHNLIANGYFAQGEWSRADAHYRQALDFFTQIGNVYSQVLVNNNLGGIALKQGRLARALAYYRQAADLLEQSGGSQWVLGALHMNMGNAHLQREELDAAGEQLRLARDYLDQVQARDLLPELLGLLAELALRRGDLARAEEECRQSLQLARELTMPREEGHTLRIAGEIALARRRYEEARRYFLDSRRTLQEAGDEYESARTGLALAALNVQTGASTQARLELDRAEAVFRRLEAGLDLRRVRSLRQQLHSQRQSA